MTGDLPANRNRVGPSQPPLNFVDGNGYIVLRGVAEARDCKVKCGKVMRVWGSGDEKVLGKIFELLFNTRRSEEQARDPDPPPPGVGKAKAYRGGGGWAPFQEVPPPPCGRCS